MEEQVTEYSCQIRCWSQISCHGSSWKWNYMAVRISSSNWGRFRALSLYVI